MKTTLRAFALAAVLAAAGLTFLRLSLPPTLVFRSPGQESTSLDARGFTVRGRVIHQGAAVQGAQVKLTPLRKFRRGVLVTAPLTRQAVTDSEGRFEVLGASEGPAQLSVIADRLAPSGTRLEIDSASGASEVVIALESGVALEGQVAAGDFAVVGAQVSVRPVGHDTDADHRPLRAGVTDDAGRFRLEGLDPAKALRLVILAEGHRPYEKTLRTPSEVTGRIDLDPGLQIWGKVVAAGGMPVAGAEIQASQGEGYTAGTRSGDSGQVRLGGLIHRPLTIRVLVEGFAPAKLDLANPYSGWTIVLRRNGGLAGRGPAGSWLVIETADATFRRGLGADGSFRWDGLPAGPAEARTTDRNGRILAARKVEIPEGEVAGGILLMP